MSAPSDYVVFPSFEVIDGSWGPCWLNISDVYGLIIESKETGQILENWQWRHTSHFTIKKPSSLLVQAKKFSGIKKIFTFAKVAELERFERVLNNAVPISTGFNMKRQRKFVVIQAPTPTCDICGEAVYPVIDVNSNVVESAPSSAVESKIPAPPPPPPPMVQMMIKIAPTKTQSAKPKNPLVNFEKQDVLKEMIEGFSKGILLPTQVKCARIALSKVTLMTSQPVGDTEEMAIPPNSAALEQDDANKPEDSALN